MPGTINQIGNQILNNQFIIGDTNNDTGGSNDLIFQKSRSLSTINNTDILGSIIAQGATGSTFTNGAEIVFRAQPTVVVGTPNIVPTEILIGTASNTTVTVQTRLRIASGGNIEVRAPDSGISLTISGGGTTASDGSIKFPFNRDNRIFIGSTIYEHSSGTSNTFLGLGAAGSNITTVTGSNNVGLGAAALFGLTTGSRNIAIGLNSGSAITAGTDNIFIGAGAGTGAVIGLGGNVAIGTLAMGASTGTLNVAIGYSSLSNLLTGFQNLAIGLSSGAAYTGSESNNILLQHVGVIGDNRVMRLGQNNSFAGPYITSTYIAGIYGVSVGTTKGFVVVDNNDQVGTAPSNILNYTNVTFAMSPYTVLATDYYLSVNSSAGSVTLNLPNAPVANTVYIVKDRTGNADINNIVVTTPGGIVTIDGQTIYPLTSRYQAISLLFNGTSYEIY